jgi:hypothetical protein
VRVRVDIPELLPELCTFLEGRGYELGDRGEDDVEVTIAEGPRDFRAAITLLADLDVWQAKRSWAQARLDPDDEYPVAR